MIIDGLAAVHEDALSRAEGIHDGEEIRPLGDLLGGRPAAEGGFIHNLRPQLGVIHDALVKGGQHAAGIQAVAGGAVFGDAHGHVLGIGQNAALGGAILGKFRARVCAGRADMQDRLDGGLDAVGLGHMDEGFEVGINIVFVLGACVVDEDLHPFDGGEAVVVADIAGVVGIACMFDA